ncbi:MAG: hypothetical protein FRX49_02720 [Trebouxia sp. A1-2]|nr:MAG: hypothetical protein FRX49_02720 [Trebouxia sp. A1-2]
MAATGTPHTGYNSRRARRKKRKLTKAADRAATPAVLAIKTVTAEVGRRASQHCRNKKMKWKQKARKAALRGACGAVLQPVEDSKAVKEEHLSNPCTRVMAEARIADQHAAQRCQTVQHGIKEEPTLMTAPTINLKTDESASAFVDDSGQEVPLASDAVKQEATCFAFSTCEVTEEAIIGNKDMLAAVVAHSSETATPSMTVQNKAQEMQGTIIRGTLPVSPSTESESGADPTAAKEVASHAGPADRLCQHGALAAPSAAETVVQSPQMKASPRKGSSFMSTSSLAAVFDSLPQVTDLSFGHEF